MLLISYGITKSGSSLSFGLALSILKAAGFEQYPLDERFIAPGHDLNYVESIDEETLLGLIASVPTGGFVAVKTHSELSPSLMELCDELIANSALKTHATIRDPRDICLSLLDAGRLARANGWADFSEIQTLNDAVASVLEQTPRFLSWSVLKDCLRLDYDTFAFDFESGISTMASHLGVSIDPQLLLQNLDEYTTHTKNKAVPARHLEDLTKSEAADLSSKLSYAMEVYERSSDYGWLATKRQSLSDNSVGPQLEIHHLPTPLLNTGLLKSFGAIPFRSETCSSHHFYFDCFAHWCDQIKERPRFHRKQWEFVYILHSLWERGVLGPGNRGLGFGVGKEPLAAVMAKNGCEVCATDLAPDDRAAAEWSKTNEHSKNLDDLNNRNICSQDAFEQLVSFQPVNMNEIPKNLKGFDFCWSACCLEHLGSIEKGVQFYKNSLETLKPGGLAIHTTEFNLSSDSETLDHAGTVLFRRSDVAALISELESNGHRCEPLLVHHGSHPIDNFIDAPPYTRDTHLRLQLQRFTTTSVGIITQKSA